MKEMPEQQDPDQMDQEAMLDAVADELLQAIEHKDKKMLRESLQALILHIQDEDQEQDQMEPQE